MSEQKARAIVELPIDEVTLMEDRARVVRRGRVECGAGLHRLRVLGVAPVLVDKSLAGRASAGRVGDVRVLRRTIHRRDEQAGAIRELDERIAEMHRTASQIERRLTRIEAALHLVADADKKTVGESAVDAAWSRLDLERLAAQLAAGSARERALMEERAERQHEFAELRRARGRLEARRGALQDPGVDHRAHLDIDLELEAEPEAGAIELTVEYVVPSALWRPCHRAVLAGERLRLETEACVWQSTGEAWEGAQLRFSTQRPSLGVEPPALATDLLSWQRKSELLQVEARQQIVESTGLGGAIERSPELPGIDDGGETLELAAPHRCSVPSDGRPHRIALFAFDADAAVELFTAPELTSAVLLKTVHDNASRRPVLAGPVDLVREGGYVGRTSVLYIAPEERFELGWGPDPALRVHREVEELPPESNLLRNWQSVTKKVTVKVSNLSSDPKRVALVERVPVSEIEKVQIEVDLERTTRRVAPDADGFLRFDLALPSFGRESVEVRYTVRRHADVIGI